MLMILIIPSTAILITAQNIGDQFYSWDDDYRKGEGPLYSWYAYAYVGARYAPNIGLYFDFTHKGYGGGSCPSQPSAKFYAQIIRVSAPELGGYTLTKVYVSLGNNWIGPIGYAYAGIGRFTGVM